MGEFLFVNYSFENFEKEMAILQRMQVRADFSAFVKNTVHDYLDAYYLNDFYLKLQKFYNDVIAKKSPRLIINMPPRHLKSETATIRLPLFTMLNNPRFEIIIASANQDLSNKFSRAARDLLKHDYVKNNWGVKINGNHKSIENWGLLNGSLLKAVGIGGQINGYGGHIVIIDDPIKSPLEANSKRLKDSQYEWFETVAAKRIAPGGGIIIVLTRWAEDDVAGRLIKKFPGRWDVVKYKAIAEENESFRKVGEILHPTRFTIAEMLEFKATTSPHYWAALYQQEPRIISGNLFQKEYFDNNRYFKSELPENFDLIITSWDFPFSKSSTSDFVAGVTMGLKGNTIYILNLVHGRYDFKETIKIVVNEYKKYRTHAVVIEARANGQAVYDSIKEDVIGAMLIHPCEDKVTRANSTTPMLESGQVKFPQEENAPWFLIFSDELLGFPRAPNDDIVDAFTQGINYLIEKIRGNGLADDLNLDGMLFRSEFNLNFFDRFGF